MGIDISAFQEIVSEHKNSAISVIGGCVLGRDKLKMVKITYFLVPFLIISIGFSILTGLTVKKRIDEQYNQLEETTLEIANSYSRSLTHTS